MAKDFMIETPSGRYGKRGVIIPAESILETLGNSEAQQNFRNNFQRIENYSKDDTFELRLTPSFDRRQKRLVVAKVYVEAKQRYAYLALHKRQEHYTLDPEKTYICRRNHFFPLIPIEGIDVYTIEIIGEKEPQAPEEAETETDEKVSLAIERNDRMAVVTFSSAEAAQIAQSVLESGWYVFGLELRRIYPKTPSEAEIAQEDSSICTLPEQIESLIEERRRIKKAAKAAVSPPPRKRKYRKRK